jgi:RNA polymerase sigma factor (sigma-70 family)
MEETPISKETDETLVFNSVSGNTKALEELIRRYQYWIYNLVLRMIYDPVQAEDLTQEILIKIITKLSTFQGKSKFRTWLYRITCNHILNTKKSRKEKMNTVSFSTYWKRIKKTPDADFPDTKIQGVEIKLLTDEIQFDCLFGMLICLKRTQRLAFILAVLFRFKDTAACKIMGIRRENFRKLLSRARKKLYNFMNDKCSLMKQGNPCQCKRKIKSLIESGFIDPQRLRFNADYLKKVRQVIPEKLKNFSDFYDKKVRELFRDQPFLEPPELNKRLAQVINPAALLKIFSLEKISLQ